MKKLIYPIATLLILIINGNSQMKSLESFSWLLDKWVNSEGESHSYESWEKINDTLFIGESKSIKNGKEIFREKLELSKIGEDIIYIADVVHNPKPVQFKLTNFTDSSVTFENLQHDFPQKIYYELRNASTLYAKIEGKDKSGKISFAEFVMTRVR